jgi:hypothetical protein
MQRYVCKACSHRFVVNPAFENAKASAKIITTAIDLYFKGVSFRKISDHLKQFYSFEIHCSNVCRYKPIVIRLATLLGKVQPECNASTDQPGTRQKLIEGSVNLPGYMSFFDGC